MTSKRIPSGESARDTSSEGTSEPGAARFVGKIVDPLVREDGLGEPELTVTGRHPVRDRLLARAAAAATADWDHVSAEKRSSDTASAGSTSGKADASSDSDCHEISEDDLTEGEPAFSELLKFGSLPGMTDDLDAIGQVARPKKRPKKPVELAANDSRLMSRVVTGALGLVAVFGLLIQGAPREPMALTRIVHSPAETQAEGLADSEAASEGLVQRPQQPQLLPSQPAPTKAVGPTTPIEQLPSVQRPPRKMVKGPWRIESAPEKPQLQKVQSKVGGESFLVSLQAAGIALKQGFRVLKAFEGVHNFDRCRSRDTYVGLIDRDSGGLQAFEYRVSSEEIYQARVGDDGLLRGKKLDLHVNRQRARGVFRVRGGFEVSALRGGFDEGLASVVNKALAGYTTVAQMKPGDVLALIAQEVTVLGEFSRYAGIEALEYRRLGEKPLRIYYQDAGKTRGYVDTKGRMFGKGRWAKPVKGAVRTSKFNPRRMHPILKVIRPHNGTDYAAPPGTPVMAAANARVKFVGKLGPNGNFIRLSHSGGYETGYSHLLRFAKGLKKGARVKQHQVIGYIGSTGRSTGPHLHFSAKKRGKFIDPESLDLDAFARLPVSDRKQLSLLRQRYDQLLAKLKIPEPIVVVEPPINLVRPSVPLALDGLDYAELQANRQSVTAALMPNKAPTGAASVGPARAKRASSLYLSDWELIQQQPAAHQGEVKR